MRYRQYSMILVLIVFAVLLSSCSSSGAPSSETGLNLANGTQSALVYMGTQPTDICGSLETKKPEVEKIIRIMEKFDDASFLVSNIPMTAANTNALVDVILVLQETRREAINHQPPECLLSLQQAEINFMSSVVLTSIGFMSNIKPEVRQRALQETRKLRETYEMELAAQLGLKYVTATPAPTVIPTIALPTSTLAPVTAKTINDLDIFVFQGAGTNYPAVGTFMHDQTTNVIGRNEAGDWLAIDVPSNPGNVGWVPKEVLTLTGDFTSVPVVESPPTPEPTFSQ